MLSGFGSSHLYGTNDLKYSACGMKNNATLEHKLYAARLYTKSTLHSHVTLLDCHLMYQGDSGLQKQHSKISY
jgi:hypothetical protein